MLNPEDKKEMEKLVFGAVIDALEQVVFPKFEKIDEKFEKVDQRFENLENEAREVKSVIETLDSDMGGVKMRLKVIENKLDTIADTTFVVREHEKRITKLEKSLV